MEGGYLMISKYIIIIRDVLNLILIGITIVERPGEGETKREEAIHLVQEMAFEFIPNWIVKLACNEKTLRLLIDYIVERLNKDGVFTH